MGEKQNKYSLGSKREGNIFCLLEKDGRKRKIDFHKVKGYGALKTSPLVKEIHIYNAQCETVGLVSGVKVCASRRGENRNVTGLNRPALRNQEGDSGHRVPHHHIIFLYIHRIQ
jgi:hypothetical protein